jgi:hypothetical protein
LFFEPFAGGAIHNGSLTPTPTLSGLGCPALFHAGFSFGAAISEHWNALATLEHLSNGKTFGVNCGTNADDPSATLGHSIRGIQAVYDNPGEHAPTVAAGSALEMGVFRW